MMASWWYVWFVFMLFFIVSPIGYGWGYRGWGPPYPRYVQRARGARAIASGGGPASFDHHSWGWGGDFVWMMVVIGVFWAGMVFWWR
jgi:hypothetical protein